MLRFTYFLFATVVGLSSAHAEQAHKINVSCPTLDASMFKKCSGSSIQNCYQVTLHENDKELATLSISVDQPVYKRLSWWHLRSTEIGKFAKYFVDGSVRIEEGSEIRLTDVSFKEDSSKDPSCTYIFRFEGFSTPEVEVKLPYSNEANFELKQCHEKGENAFNCELVER